MHRPLRTPALSLENVPVHDEEDRLFLVPFLHSVYYYFKFNSVKANSPPNEPLANTLNEIETLFLEVLFTPTD